MKGFSHFNHLAFFAEYRFCSSSKRFNNLPIVNGKLTSGKLVLAASVFLKKQFSNKNVNSTP